MGYDYTIEYKRGKENSAAYALSHVPHESELAAISTPVPLWIAKIKETNG